MRDRGRQWLRLGLPLIVTCACNARALDSQPAAGAGRGSLPGSAVVGDASAGAGIGGAGGAVDAGGGVVGGSTGGTTSDAGAPDGGAADGRPSDGRPPDGGTTVCPPMNTGSPAQVPYEPPPTPTRVPFSCQGMPATFFFPKPGSDVPGLFSRCASYAIGAAKAVAVSPDGQLAVLVTEDGLARVVALASGQVIAVLASPRAMIDAVTFEPQGRAVMTLARAQREVTLWRTGDWQASWRITLPGTRYYHLFGGAVAFAPDGRSAVVSPGSDTFLLDAATGAVRAHRTTSWETVLDASYGWGGRRIVVSEPSLAAHCNHGPNGGKVMLLDPDTLVELATLADFGDYSHPGGYRGIPRFRASPADDLVLVSPNVDGGPSLRAFKLSDGSALPPSPLTVVPDLFMPDGTTVLAVDAGQLERIRVADGVAVSTTLVGDRGPIAMSADASVLALGGSGDQLLRVLGAVDPAVAPAVVCSGPTPAPPAYLQVAASLSADGQRLALASETEIRVLARNGTTVAVTGPGSPALSPSGTLLVVGPWQVGQQTAVSRLSDGVALATLTPDRGYWSGFVFPYSERTVYGTSFLDGVSVVKALDLASGGVSDLPVPDYSKVIGVSMGCPVVYQGERGVWRSCGACEDPPVAAGGSPYNATRPSSGVVAEDGFYAAIRSDVTEPGVTLWRLPPAPARIGTFASRADVASWNPEEFPIAIGPSATRLITGADQRTSCYAGPQFEVHVHDVASGAVIDALPPAPALVDRPLRTIAYGAQLWCAR